MIKSKVNNQKKRKTKKTKINKKNNNHNKLMGLIKFKVKFKITPKFPIKKDNQNKRTTIKVIYPSYLIVTVKFLTIIIKVIKYQSKTTKKANYLNKKRVK